MCFFLKPRMRSLSCYGHLIPAKGNVVEVLSLTLLSSSCKLCSFHFPREPREGNVGMAVLPPVCSVQLKALQKQSGEPEKQQLSEGPQGPIRTPIFSLIKKDWRSCQCLRKGESPAQHPLCKDTLLPLCLRDCTFMLFAGGRLGNRGVGCGGSILSSCEIILPFVHYFTFYFPDLVFIVIVVLIKKTVTPAQEQTGNAENHYLLVTPKWRCTVYLGRVL